jgi:manganese oxidase
VAVGQTRTIEFVADNAGDWAFHCHMSHHVMNQMGHAIPNLLGVETGTVDKKVRTFLSGYMTMGKDGMGDMGDMGMKVPRNSIPMVGGQGPHDYITMGGLFAILKVRENLESYEGDPGWYENPPGTEASLASNDELRRDLGQIPDTKPTDKDMKMDHGKMNHS